jgi:hypothetical protein
MIEPQHGLGGGPGLGPWLFQVERNADDSVLEVRVDPKSLVIELLRANFLLSNTCRQVSITLHV